MTIIGDETPLRQIRAVFDAETIRVYQAYSDDIADSALAHGRFVSPPFKMERMTWIKPSFLWMMYRAGWATKPGQERVLAIRLARAGFDQILARAVHASYERDVYGDRTAWQAALKGSDVRLQWDPDHDPAGAPQARRAIQLGLAGETLRQYVLAWCVAIHDVTPFVAAQRGVDRDAMIVPVETVVSVTDPAVAGRLQLSPRPAI